MELKIKIYLIFLFSLLTNEVCHSLTGENELISDIDQSKIYTISASDSELLSSYDDSVYSEDQSILKNISISKDQHLYSHNQIMEYDNATGYLGLVAILTNKKQTCGVISGNFQQQNDAKNTLYLFFDTTNKNYIGVFVPKQINFTIKGKLGLVTLVYNQEFFLLNKFLLVNSVGEISPTNSPWKLVIEANSDYNKLQILPFELRNKNYIKPPPDDWDANEDSIYPNNIKGIKPLSILAKNMSKVKELKIPHFSVGTSPTALFLKLSTGEFLSIIVANNTVFFVDTEDCSIHSSDGHYFNFCAGYSVYSNKWFQTNKPWKSRIIIQSSFESLLEITKSKLQVLDNVEKSSTTLRRTEITPKFYFKKCGKYSCCRK